MLQMQMAVGQTQRIWQSNVPTWKRAVNRQTEFVYFQLCDLQRRTSGLSSSSVVIDQFVYDVRTRCAVTASLSKIQARANYLQTPKWGGLYSDTCECQGC